MNDAKRIAIAIAPSVMIMDDLMFVPNLIISDLIAIRDVLDIPILPHSGMVNSIVCAYEETGAVPFDPVPLENRVVEMDFRIPEICEESPFIEEKKGRRRGQRKQNRRW